LFVCLKVEVLFFLLLYGVCRYSYITKHSGGHETCEKDQNGGGGWQLFSKTLAGKELKRILITCIAYFKTAM